jgi:hypothetical protein
MGPGIFGAWNLASAVYRFCFFSVCVFSAKMMDGMWFFSLPVLKR